MPKSSDFQALALERMTDAKSLFDSKRYAAAYYMAGFAVECALKACIAKQYIEAVPSQKFENKFYKHKLIDLFGLVEEKQKNDLAKKRGTRLFDNWNVVTNWDINERYGLRKDRASAEELINALEEPHDGVLKWLKNYW